MAFYHAGTLPFKRLYWKEELALQELPGNKRETLKELSTKKEGKPSPNRLDDGRLGLYLKIPVEMDVAPHPQNNSYHKEHKTF